MLPITPIPMQLPPSDKGLVHESSGSTGSSRTWTCQSGTIVVIDPCNGKQATGGKFPIAILANAAAGQWEGKVKIEQKHGRVKELLSWCGSLDGGNWKLHERPVGVSTGLLGIFDVTVVSETADDEALLDQSCAASPGVCGFGSVADGKGIVCTSGYGDGFYEVRFREEKGTITGISVVFITPERTARFEELAASSPDGENLVIDMILSPTLAWAIAMRENEDELESPTTSSDT